MQQVLTNHPKCVTPFWHTNFVSLTPPVDLGFLLWGWYDLVTLSQTQVKSLPLFITDRLGKNLAHQCRFQSEHTGLYSVLLRIPSGRMTIFRKPGFARKTRY